MREPVRFPTERQLWSIVAASRDFESTIRDWKRWAELPSCPMVLRNYRILRAVFRLNLALTTEEPIDPDNLTLQNGRVDMALMWLRDLMHSVNLRHGLLTPEGIGEWDFYGWKQLEWPPIFEEMLRSAHPSVPFSDQSLLDVRSITINEKELEALSEINAILPPTEDLYNPSEWTREPGPRFEIIWEMLRPEEEPELRNGTHEEPREEEPELRNGTHEEPREDWFYCSISEMNQALGVSKGNKNRIREYVELGRMEWRVAPRPLGKWKYQARFFDRQEHREKMENIRLQRHPEEE